MWWRGRVVGTTRERPGSHKVRISFKCDSYNRNRIELPNYKLKQDKALMKSPFDFCGNSFTL